MTITRQARFLILGLFFLGLVLALQFRHQHERLEVTYSGHHGIFSHVGKTWVLDSLDGSKPLDQRVNQKLFRHLLDLNRANQARLIVVETNPIAVKLLSRNGLFDLRDAHIMTFSSDDIEELTFTGTGRHPCPEFHLFRDGDRWQSFDQPDQNTRINRWLDQFTSIAYGQTQEALARDAEAFCKIEIVGRKNRRELLTLNRHNGMIWSSNSALPAFYQLPPESQTLLTRPF